MYNIIIHRGFGRVGFGDFVQVSRFYGGGAAARMDSLMNRPTKVVELETRRNGQAFDDSPE